MLHSIKNAYLDPNMVIKKPNLGVNIVSRKYRLDLVACKSVFYGERNLKVMGENRRDSTYYNHLKFGFLIFLGKFSSYRLPI